MSKSKVTKPQLVDWIASITNTPKATVADVVDCLLTQISAQAGHGTDVYLHGFGTFKRKDKAARTARNPKTGEPVAVEAKQVLVFKAATSKEGA